MAHDTVDGFLPIADRRGQGVARHVPLAFRLTAAGAVVGWLCKERPG